MLKYVSLLPYKNMWVQQYALIWDTLIQSRGCFSDVLVMFCILKSIISILLSIKHIITYFYYITSPFLFQYLYWWGIYIHLLFPFRICSLHLKNAVGFPVATWTSISAHVSQNLCQSTNSFRAQVKGLDPPPKLQAYPDLYSFRNISSQ